MSEASSDRTSGFPPFVVSPSTLLRTGLSNHERSEGLSAEVRSPSDRTPAEGSETLLTFIEWISNSGYKNVLRGGKG